jgi:hypothetical protein
VRGGLDQCIKVLQQVNILAGQLFAATTCGTDPYTIVLAAGANFALFPGIPSLLGDNYLDWILDLPWLDSSVDTLR